MIVLTVTPSLVAPPCLFAAPPPLLRAWVAVTAECPLICNIASAALAAVNVLKYVTLLKYRVRATHNDTRRTARNNCASRHSINLPEGKRGNSCLLLMSEILNASRSLAIYITPPLDA